jgi:two-component system sensor histidine kinase FlrB
LSNPAQPPSPQELEQAFALFNRASAQLASAYEDLQQQVARLTGELAFANGELRQQYVEKEALSQRLALLLEALPGGVVVLDPQGLVAQANPTARRLLGDDVVGQSWSGIEAERLSVGGAPQEWQLRAGEASRQPHWVSISASPFDAAGGRILLLSDITEARGLREALERHQRLSAMGQMAAGLAHQLRTPLATALLYAGNLARTQLSEADRQRFAERVQARLRDLERMIQDMLSFVRGEAAGEDAFAVDELMHELAQVMEPQMQARGVRFEVHTQCASARVRGNRKALSGAFVNLLENALQACGTQGEVRLDARVARGMVQVSVSDNGAGMDSAVQARLFEPFFTTRSEGTGLGLAIVRNVTQSHGGEIRVESAPGRGSVFSVSLPVAAP